MSEFDQLDPLDDGVDAPDRGVREALLLRVGVSSTDAWEYESVETGGGLVAWAQTHVAIAFVAAALAWFGGVFILALVVGYFV